MYFGILKIKMDSETTNDQSLSHAVSLCGRTRVKFKALAMAYEQDSDESKLSIAVTLLDPSEERLKQRVDGLLAFFENNGLGRVWEHHLICESIDVLEDDDEV